MMVICIELKIPLFLVGKPGSSKSLAKIIVADAMQGQAAFSDLFRCLKQVHLVSFQCSPPFIYPFIETAAWDLSWSHILESPQEKRL